MNLGARFFLIIPPITLAALMFSFARPPWTPLRIAGGVVAIAGFALLTLARLQLGNSFSLTPQARTLVTRGIYSRVRNPIYVFSAVGLAGLILYINRPALFVIYAVLVPMQWLRARAEARVLEQKFGDQYREYRRRTWF
jgi:protein-S-isoprenylcysteine O-methyltransferase Ste14